jgi:hypothetical protein
MTSWEALSVDYAVRCKSEDNNREGDLGFLDYELVSIQNNEMPLRPVKVPTSTVTINPVKFRRAHTIVLAIPSPKPPNTRMNSLSPWGLRGLPLEGVARGNNVGSERS